MYAVLKRALYWDLFRSLLFWRYLVRKLKSWGLHPNPYDPCAMDKVVEDNYCNVCWHVDCLKISHVH